MNKRILFSLLIMVVISLSSMAHAPKKIILKFNTETNTLSADIIHKVKDISSHYISDVIIYVNDVEVKKASFEKQAEKENEEAEYLLENIKVGDEIKLVAKCNKFGKKSAKLVVE